MRIYFLISIVSLIGTFTISCQSHQTVKKDDVRLKNVNTNINNKTPVNSAYVGIDGHWENLNQPWEKITINDGSVDLVKDCNGLVVVLEHAGFVQGNKLVFRGGQIEKKAKVDELTTTTCGIISFAMEVQVEVSDGNLLMTTKSGQSQVFVRSH